jgi:galactose mutarotase-like enzyme
VVKFKDYPNIAFWSKPGADYVCVEPWLGLPDRENESVDITKKSTFKKLQPNQKYSIDIETVIER